MNEELTSKIIDEVMKQIDGGTTSVGAGGQAEACTVTRKG